MYFIFTTDRLQTPDQNSPCYKLHQENPLWQHSDTTGLSAVTATTQQNQGLWMCSPQFIWFSCAQFVSYSKKRWHPSTQSTRTVLPLNALWILFIHFRTHSTLSLFSYKIDLFTLSHLFLCVILPCTQTCIYGDNTCLWLFNILWQKPMF